ncbi:MAG: DUF4336 domain-containing protein [Candidatus Dadabacteria bacterium]|nr:DUF4336 domain-containing protein [Candidatus Dadabacteria bacterium]
MPASLIPLARDIWTAASSQVFLGMDVGSRMTVVRLASGFLLVHSPIRPADALKSELDALGEVRFIVAPNKYHHLYAGEFSAAFPDARLYVAPGLEEKRKDLGFHGILTEEPEPFWEDSLEQHVFQGIPAVNEVVFFHPASRTVIFTDLVFNFSSGLTPGQKLFALLYGVYDKTAVSRLTRYILLGDRKRARRSADRILEWDFDKVVLAHKDIVHEGGYEAVKKAFEKL